MSPQNLQPFNQLACGVNRALCQGVQLARRGPQAIKPTPQKVTAANSKITDTTKAKPGALNNDVNKIDGDAKKGFKPKLKADDGDEPEDAEEDNYKAPEDAPEDAHEDAPEDAPEEENDSQDAKNAEDELGAESKLSGAGGKLKVPGTTHSPQPGPAPDTAKKPEAAIVSQPEPKPDTAKKPEAAIASQSEPKPDTAKKPEAAIASQPEPKPDTAKKPEAAITSQPEPKPNTNKKPESDANKKKPRPNPDANKKPEADKHQPNAKATAANQTQAEHEKKPSQEAPGEKPAKKAQQKPKCLPNRRKEIRELKPEELKAYIEAIKTLHNKQKPEQPSKFDKYAATHVKQHKYIHGVPAFLPWHRQFIRNYELELQKINPSVTLPYWDWTIDSQEPHKSPILSSAMFGGNGNSAEDMCVTEGPFAHWMVTTPSPHCLRRDYADGDSIPALTPIDVMTGIISDTKEYEDFVFDLEVHHGPLHLDVGGERGDLNPMHSPNDPLFFLHHTFIDMVWYNWQMKHPNSKAYGGKAEGRAVSMSDKLEPFNVTVKEVINTRSPGLCYFYDPYHPKVASLKKRTGFSFETLSTQNLTRGTAPAPSNKETLKPVQHLPEAWLRMNNLDVNRAREVEKERDTATNNLNALGVTPASK